MNSCIYKCTVMHHRMEPRENKFSYSVFMFLLDLDELTDISKKIKFISYNRPNLFSFSDKHHSNFPAQTNGKETSIKTKILEYLSSEGINTNQIQRISLLTNLSTLGYVFNPISIYYCYDNSGEMIYSVAEVCNTFKEMKLYLLRTETKKGDTFTLLTPKLFYVSPFSELDIDFRFIIKKPGESIDVKVNDYKEGNCFFTSSLTGKKKELSDRLLIKYSLAFPMITLKIITLIHWQAFVLYLKKIPFIKKDQNISLQQNLVKL